MKAKHVLNVVLVSSLLLAMTSLLCSCGGDAKGGKKGADGKGPNPVPAVPARRTTVRPRAATPKQPREFVVPARLPRRMKEFLSEKPVERPRATPPVRVETPEPEEKRLFPEFRPTPKPKKEPPAQDLRSAMKSLEEIVLLARKTQRDLLKANLAPKKPGSRE